MNNDDGWTKREKTTEIYSLLICAQHETRLAQTVILYDFAIIIHIPFHAFHYYGW